MCVLVLWVIFSIGMFLLSVWMNSVFIFWLCVCSVVCLNNCVLKLWFCIWCDIDMLNFVIVCLLVCCGVGV